MKQKEVIIMDMYQKRKIRAEKKKDDSPKGFPSVGINWYIPTYGKLLINLCK